MAQRRLKVGLYGANGHQVHQSFTGAGEAELVGVAAFPADKLPPDLAGVRQHPTLDGLLADSQVELVSLCSPYRRDQAADILKALRAGKHVYAEKPAALAEADLDTIMAVARTTGREFHEQAGTVVQQPYRAMRQQIAAGAIGTVVQVLVQKCYPWGDWRPKDEAIDGGLAVQAGIYPMRFVEHIAGVKIAALHEFETKLGNPQPDSNCRLAVSMIMRLANGGLASAVCNYLNPMQQRCWGYEIVRVFGTSGIIESSLEAGRLRLIRTGQEPVDLGQAPATEDYFHLYVRSLLGGPPLPLSTEEELSATRWAIRGKEAAGRG